MSLPPPGSAVVDAYEDTVVTPKSLKRRRQVKPFSCFRCCAILAIILCVVVGSLTIFLLLRTTTTLVRHFRSPLGRELYAAPGANRSTVQPLIDTDTRFDVAVTVWARRANADTAHPEMYADDWEDEAEVTEAQRFLYSRIGMPLVELSHLPEEDIVFSKIVIEDSSLNDKDRDVDVNFELPLARFEDEWIYPNDVRVTVVINPRSPSVLDHVTNFTSVKPTIMQWPRLNPSLAWGEDGSVHRAVVENMAVSIPLVKFVDQYDIIFDDFDDPDPRNEAHVYFVNETRHLDREMWETKFKMWSEQGWERDKSLVNGTRFVGHNSSYEVAGHWEAGYELAGDVDKEGNRPLAYSPYIGVMQHGAGPLHRIRLPITRPFMADMEDGSDLPDVQHGPSSINMTLSLRVSVLNPYRERLFHLKDHVTNAMSPAHNQTELELKQAHYWWDLSP
ncbi:uncharacterized protein EHS24_004343 [Apiotrichum porosum]|uniref:Uncharacterized protein n=1 Tax=Apiotrichum porosum TaxID=105984 RepID=A0A427Y4V7_9TREE|nr:uncharacterized protein EHS24_004343 [Apiotrichum porosum]RSH86118.1 hypothetical protein EHS24_004343 [Apiotrichum porosum]